MLQLVVNQVDKIRRLGGFRSSSDNLNGRVARQRIIPLADVPVLPHQGQHHVAPIADSFGMAVRIVVTGPLDEPGEGSGLGEIDLPDILAKVRVRRLPESANFETSAAPQIDLVAVELEDLFFGEFLFEFERDHDFGGLALPALLAVQPEIARQLHAQGGGPLGFAALFQVFIHRLHDAERIEAAVLEEALVFSRNDGVDQDFRNVVEMDQPALLAIAVVEIRDQLRLKLKLAAVRVVLERDDLGDPAARELDDALFLAEVGFGSGKDFQGVGTEVVPPHGVAACFGVSAAAQCHHNLGGRNIIAHSHNPGSREDFGSVDERTAAQLLVDQAGVLDVKIGETENPNRNQQHRSN